MSLLLSNCVFFGSHSRSSRFSHASASLEAGVQRATSSQSLIAPASASFEETKGRIAKLFQKNEVSVSTYDTAWVAMVPSPTSSEEPCFPASLNWLLENQCLDGSWARPHHHPLLKKDVLSSTLACILALQKWGHGEDHIHRGLHFIELNFASATDDQCQITPVGFEIVFPAMLDRARGLSLNLRLEPTALNDLMNKRDLELKRCYEINSTEREVYWAYIAEGMGKLQKWESVMKYQRKNGSLFNCPSTTAAAFTALGNSDCLNYLHLASNKFGGAVPAVYPLDIYSQLCIVDNLESLGISRHFVTEIQSVLDGTYRCWVQGDEEILMDASTCALAFRTLRMNGYNVPSDPITKILQEESFGGNMRVMNTILELYRASELILHPDEKDLEEHNLRLKTILEQELSGGGLIQLRQLGRNIDAEVKQALEYPFYATIERMAKRRNIEQYHIDNTRILKTSYWSPNFGNEDFLSLSVEDFNRCQVMHQEELRELDRWVIENRFDELKFARSKAAYCYFSAAATFFSPQLSDARMSWAKNGFLTTVVDDFFDVAGSAEELNNLITLFELWDVDVSKECISPSVQILFSAIKQTICEIGDIGFKLQGRSIMDHIISIWLDMLHSMMKEKEWGREKVVPTIDEYIDNAYVSFALGPIVLPALYLVGPKISEEMVNHADYHNLFKSMSTCCRLLNDIRSYERELKAGKLNSVALYMMNNEMSREAAMMEVKSWIHRETRELLRSVLEEESVLPKVCKELFWYMNTVVHLFYSKDDGYSSQDLLSVVNPIIYQPIVIE